MTDSSRRAIRRVRVRSGAARITLLGGALAAAGLLGLGVANATIPNSANGQVALCLTGAASDEFSVQAFDDQAAGSACADRGGITVRVLGNLASVGADQLRAATNVTSAAIVAPGGFVTQTTDCPAGTRLLSGGAEWAPTDNLGERVAESFPAGNSWTVTGENGSAVPKFLVVHALCLQS